MPRPAGNDRFLTALTVCFFAVVIACTAATAVIRLVDYAGTAIHTAIDGAKARSNEQPRTGYIVNPRQ